MSCVPTRPPAHPRTQACTCKRTLRRRRRSFFCCSATSSKRCFSSINSRICAHPRVCVCVCVCVCARARARARTTSMQTSKQALLHVATVRCVHTHTDTQQPQAHTHGDMPHLHAAIKNQEENLDLEILVRILSCSLLQLLQHVFVFLC